MNKVTKTKIITCSLLGLASVSLFSVAFSSFIVTNDQLTATSGDVTVTVGDVVDESISITGLSITNNKIAFEPKENDTTGPIIWDGTHSEDLDFAFTFTLTNVLTSEGKWGNRLGGVNIKWNQGDSGTFATCITNKYITAPKLGGSGGGSGTELTTSDAPLFSVEAGQAPANSSTDGLIVARDAQTADVTVTVNYAFAWGDAFYNDNPGNATDENYTAIKTALDDFKAKLTDTKFTITIAPFLVPAE